MSQYTLRKQNQLRLTERDRLILSFCEKPRTIREIAKKMAGVDKNARERTHRLRKNGYLDVIKPMDSDGLIGWRYFTCEPPESAEPKVYKPVGICVFGVWL